MVFVTMVLIAYLVLDWAIEGPVTQVLGEVGRWQ